MNRYIINRDYKESYSESDLQNIRVFSYGTEKMYLIEKNLKPYFLVEFGIGYSPFDEVCIFGEYLCTGTGHKIIFLHLATFESKTVSIEEEMYFGYFYEYNNVLYVASGTGITAFDENLNILWKNTGLAVDGVLFTGITNNGNFLEISCEMNPPGDWQDKFLDINTGKVVSERKCL